MTQQQGVGLVFLKIMSSTLIAGALNSGMVQVRSEEQAVNIYFVLSA